MQRAQEIPLLWSLCMAAVWPINNNSNLFSLHRFFVLTLALYAAIHVNVIALEIHPMSAISSCITGDFDCFCFDYHSILRCSRRTEFDAKFPRSLHRRSGALLPPHYHWLCVRILTHFCNFPHHIPAESSQVNGSPCRSNK